MSVNTNEEQATAAASVMTLGEVADVLRGLLANGVTLGALRYATERVYWEEMHEEQERSRLLAQMVADSQPDWQSKQAQRIA